MFARQARAKKIAAPPPSHTYNHVKKTFFLILTVNAQAQELEKLRRIIAANSNTAELKKEEAKDRISTITQQLSTTLVLRSRT